ncbi:MAG: DUF3990 domain-containing protein [Treponema sp.]|nr:DUF3990 domain-containing protein [Treponema sp.]
MKALKKGLVLYHGSYCSVEDPDLEKCALYKDFGRGFYLTTSKEQAKSFAKISAAKQIAKGNFTGNFAFLSFFRVKDISDLNLYIFETANIPWLKAIVAHRSGNTFKDVRKSLEEYDVVSGKIANDNTNATITAYMNGLYGPLESEKAGSICISLLLPEKLQDQFCFRTKKALEVLEFLKTEKVALE